MTIGRKRLGGSGEALAADFLKRRGYLILETNYRCRLGEIDLIAQKGDVLAICEVKTRRGTAFGHPLEAITPAKQARLRALGEYYWSFTNDRRLVLRFDAVSIIQTPEGPLIDHFEDAF
jgi:putative endonuclease